MIDETETRGRKSAKRRPARFALDRRLAASSTCHYLLGKTSRLLPDLKVAMTDNASMREESEAIAVRALGFVAADLELLPRFLAITGIEAASIRRAATEPGFLAGVLQFIQAHEPTLMRFSEETGTPPDFVGKALKALPLGNDEYDVST